MTPAMQREIRNYLMSGAGGVFYGADKFEAVMKALKHSKIEGISGEEFEQVLGIYGIAVDQVRDRFQLVLPLASR